MRKLRVRNPIFFFGPDFVMLGLFALLLMILVHTYDAHFTFLQGTFILPIVSLVAFAAVSYLARLRYIVLKGQARPLPRPKEILRDWLPFILIAFVYENLHEFTNVINKDTVDATLRAFDRSIFGNDVGLILERITTPLLTEYMTFAYALYFVFPTIILAILYGREERFKFREFSWALSLCLYLGFVGYVLVPAIGPRYFMANEFNVPLTGIFITAKAAAAWNSIERVQKDCFPSLHTAFSTICLIYFWRFRYEWSIGRKLLYVCAPLIVSLQISTLYLRYHWFADLIGGWSVAYFCCWFSPRFTKWYYGHKLGIAPEVSTDVVPHLK
ncbi:MAG: phosphatase PAP2 family protein [Bdellovibrionales bacterium]|nr:phosphatase PAP2 family protein [Bdellovibrionales bacterium]